MLRGQRHGREVAMQNRRNIVCGNIYDMIGP